MLNRGECMSAITTESSDLPCSDVPLPCVWELLTSTAGGGGHAQGVFNVAHLSKAVKHGVAREIVHYRTSSAARRHRAGCCHHPLRHPMLTAATSKHRCHDARTGHGRASAVDKFARPEGALWRDGHSCPREASELRPMRRLVGARVHCTYAADRRSVAFGGEATGSPRRSRLRQHKALAACNSLSVRRATSLNSSSLVVSLQRS
jgi:hypothetical protein